MWLEIKLNKPFSLFVFLCLISYLADRETVYRKYKKVLSLKKYFVLSSIELGNRPVNIAKSYWQHLKTI